ncbi:MAG: hypothetical protein RIT14_1462 [Pseudomonadota bacterium]|jgi:hypothetical protein
MTRRLLPALLALCLTAPPALAETAATCAAQGGNWGPAGLLPDPICILPTPDAGAACDRATDCQSFCLAETRTCAPTTPFFGCHAILQPDGTEVTLCID